MSVPFLRFVMVATLWLAGFGPLSAAMPRVATVDASILFKGYHRTKTEQTKLAEAKLKLQKDPRLAVIKQIRQELQELRNEVRSTSNSELDREEFFRKFQMKSHELRSLQRDTTQQLEVRQKELNRRLVEMSKALLAEIQAKVQQVAGAEGYDMVLEKGGDTSSQVPTLIYIRHATDITDLVLKELNKNKPPRGVTPLPAGTSPPAGTSLPPGTSPGSEIPADPRIVPVP